MSEYRIEQKGTDRVGHFWTAQCHRRTCDSHSYGQKSAYPKVEGVPTSKTQFTAITSINSSNDEVVSQVPFDPFSSDNIRKRLVLILFFIRRLCKTSKKRLARLDLCSVSPGAGSLSPQNDTLQLNDRYGGGDDDDDKSGDGDDGHDDDVLHNIKELGVVQIELCRHKIVDRDVGLWVNHWLHCHL